MTTHILYYQIQEPESQGGKFHESGETGDFTNIFPDIERLIADGHVGIIPDPVQLVAPTINRWNKSTEPTSTPDNEVNNA